MDRKLAHGLSEAASPEQALRGIVHRYKVYWQVFPELAIRGTSRIQVGFRLCLLGAHDHPDAGIVAGCPECWQLYGSLRTLADWIVPQEDRLSEHFISSFDMSLLYPTGSNKRKDNMLTIKISHRNGYDSPVDACETRCLTEMQDKLRSLGAPQGQWSEKE